MSSEDVRNAGARQKTGLRERFRNLPYEPYLYPILAVAFLLRLPDLSRSLWLDEAYSVMARGAADPVGIVTMEGPHPPLYFLLLKFWTDAFGTSEIAVRAPSLLFGLGCVAAAYLLARELYDRQTGLITAVLVSVSTLYVQYSQTARMYSALTLFALLSTYFYVRLLDSNAPRDRFGYVATGALMVLTHVYGWFVVLAHFLHLAAYARRRRDVSTAIRWLKTQAVVGAFALPWIAFVLVPTYVLESNSDTSWIPDPDSQVLRDIVLSYAGVPVNYPKLAITDVSMTVGYAFIALSVGAVAYLLVDELRDDGRLSRGTALLALFAVAVVAVPYLVSITVSPILIVRYGLLGSIPLLVLLARAVARLPRRTVRIGFAAVLVALLLSGLAAYYQAPTSENWAGLTDTLNDDDLSDDLLVYNPGYVEDPVSYYLSGESRSAVTAVASENVSAVDGDVRSGAFDQVWIASYGTDDPDLDVSLSPEYRRNETRSFGALSLVEYRATGTDGRGDNASRSDPPATVGSAPDVESALAADRLRSARGA